MPIILSEKIALDTAPGPATLFLWEIAETAAELERLVAPGVAADSHRFAPPPRRAQHLAWRAALAGALPGAEMAYSGAGSPLVTNMPGIYIGVSHCDGAAAVVVSPRPCAVDIETAARDFGHALPRFASTGEVRMAEETGDPSAAGMVWCAKEAMYKYSGRRGLDLRADLTVKALDIPGGMATGTIAGFGEVTLGLLRRDRWIGAWIV